MPYINAPGSGGGGAISGVTVSGTAAAGDVPVASSAAAGTWAFPPGHEFGYDQITAPVTIASSTEATGTTVITCGAHVFDGQAVVATFSAPFLQTPSGASATATICLFEGATQIGRLCGVSDPSAGQDWVPATGMLRFTPTAASHTYTVTVFGSSAAGAVGAGAGGTAAYVPAFIQFTKV